jgi:hypothetical protein
MALVRRDEPARRQLSADSSYNVSITLSITLDAYTEDERMALLLSPTEGQSDWRAIHPYQRKPSEVSSIDLQANGLSEYYSD